MNGDHKKLFLSWAARNAIRSNDWVPKSGSALREGGRDGQKIYTPLTLH